MNRYLVSLTVLVSFFLLGSSNPAPYEALPTQPGFVDVQGNAVWAQAVLELESHGYVAGRGEDRFEPGAAMTQAEMSVLLLRASHGPDYQPPAYGGEWWQGWAHEAAAEGLMDEIQQPDLPATRAEVATLMWMSMDRQP
jgi:S-layer homology domain